MSRNPERPRGVVVVGDNQNLLRSGSIWNPGSKAFCSYSTIIRNPQNTMFCDMVPTAFSVNHLLDLVVWDTIPSHRQVRHARLSHGSPYCSFPLTTRSIFAFGEWLVQRPIAQARTNWLLCRFGLGGPICSRHQGETQI